MARQPGFFDVDDRLRRLSDIGDQLEAYIEIVDFEVFRVELEVALNYSDGTKGGRLPFDAVLMFTILIIQAQNNLGDDHVELLERPQLRARLIFLDSRIPGKRPHYRVFSGSTVVRCALTIGCRLTASAM